MIEYPNGWTLNSLTKAMMVVGLSSAISSVSSADERDKTPRKAANSIQSPKFGPGPIQVDDVTLKLFEQYIVRTGKISSSHIDAALVLVAARGGGNRQFVTLVLDEFDKTYADRKQRNSRRTILKLLTKILYREGSYRWQFERTKRTGVIEQRAIPIPTDPSYLYADSETLKRVLKRGRQADRHDIDAFVLAIRAAHHSQGTEFLLDVIRNPDNGSLLGGDAPRTKGKWEDNIGGTWYDARFHAAVGLAEIGNHEGVEWLIRNSRQNRDVASTSIYRAPHARDTRGNYRTSSIHALADLSGQKFTDDDGFWSTWWAENKEEFEGKRAVSLRDRY